MVLGLTAQQVAERTDFTRDTFRKIETGDASVNFRNVTQVLCALGVLDQAVEILVGEAASPCLTGQAYFTKQRGGISTTFLYDPGWMASDGKSIEPRLEAVAKST